MLKVQLNPIYTLLSKRFEKPSFLGLKQLFKVWKHSLEAYQTYFHLFKP